MIEYKKGLIFQFQYGAIRRLFTAHYAPIYLYFNSSMVQLEVPKKVRVEVPVQFQFQYGAIRS